MKIKITATQNPFEGAIHIDGDKSITHRAIMISSIANGITKIKNYLASEDCLSTIQIIRSLGIKIVRDKNDLYVYGRGIYGYKEPEKPLYAGNSGTTIRLMTGILAGQNFLSIIHGDKSLNNRPMKRIITPLNKFGSNIYGRQNNAYAPIVITPNGKIKSFIYHSRIASAQVKSAILFSALNSKDTSIYSEIYQSRDHTERMLKLFNADIKTTSEKIKISGKNKLMSTSINVPNDFSTASYFIALAALIKNSSLVIKNVNVNETRTGFLSVLHEMGLNYTFLNYKEVSNEPTADILVKCSKLSNIEVDKSQIATMIDEIPLLAFVASQAKGEMVIKGIKELAYKESNRIQSTKYMFSKFGLNLKVEEDKMIITGSLDESTKNLSKSVEIKHFDDHRIAMTAVVMSLVLRNEISMKDIEVISISSPTFLDVINDISKGAIRYE